MNSARQVVVITGAASGIGQGLGREFAKSGSLVIKRDLFAEYGV